MTFDLTPERKSYLSISGHVVLNACPGSGKTTTVAHKLALLQKDWDRRFGARAGIACLSFTNVAKNEIAATFKQTSGYSLSYPHVVSTIDSFVNTNITLPFAHHITHASQRFRIIDDLTFLDTFFDNQWPLKKTHGQLFFRYPPSKIDFALDGTFKWDGNPIAQSAPLRSYCADMKSAQLRAGLLKTSDSAYFAVKLLQKLPRIGVYLIARFPYIIVDEAQDTSDVQHAILDSFRQSGLQHLELVGDPYQSLYEWRDASPDLFLEKHRSQDWQGLTLSENRRSSQKIVDTFSPLRNSDEKPIRAINNRPEDPPLHILMYDPADPQSLIPTFVGLCDRYNLKDNRVLVRGNALKNTLLGTVAEFKPWTSDLPYYIVRSQLHLSSNEVSEAIKTLRRALLVALNTKSTFDAIRSLEEELESDIPFHGSLFSILRQMPGFDRSVTQWTIDAQRILNDALSSKTPLDFQIRKRGSKNLKIQSLALPMSTFFRSASIAAQLPVMTVHQAKGMTFDSVLLVLSSNSRGQNISVADCQPTPVSPSEKRRIIYVAMSRPRQLLCLGVPHPTSESVLRDTFGPSIVVL